MSTTIEHIARTLWLCAYADGIEETEGDKITGPRPGAGEDWDDYAPDTPAEALHKATELAATIGGEQLETMEIDWIEATGLDAERFGHCVALQSLGHGVGLSDDVPYGTDYERPELPPIEFHIWDVASLPAGVEWSTN